MLETSQTVVTSLPSGEDQYVAHPVEVLISSSLIYRRKGTVENNLKHCLSSDVYLDFGSTFGYRWHISGAARHWLINNLECSCPATSVKQRIDNEFGIFASEVEDFLLNGKNIPEARIFNKHKLSKLMTKRVLVMLCTDIIFFRILMSVQN